MTNYAPHPMQPVIKDDHGILRFRDNPIIRTMVDDLVSLVATEGPRRGKLDLDKVAAIGAPAEDQAQFEQLAGMKPGRPNAIVQYVIEHAQSMVATHPMHAGRLDLNGLYTRNFPRADREQFAQLMGYSISGYHELSYVSDLSAAEATLLAEKIMPGAGGCRDQGCPIHSLVKDSDDDEEDEDDEEHEVVNENEFSGGPDIAADEVLRMGALIYAGKTITLANGTPPGPQAPAALDDARQTIRPGNSMPPVVAEALCNLQLAAGLFTLDLAEDHVDPTALQRLEDALVETLRRRGASGIVHRDSDATATQSLSDRALDYARQIFAAEESRAPIGTNAVVDAATAFQLAAVAFTVQLAVSENLDAEIPRWVEERLVAMFEQERSLS
jgi:hypothetical protein